MLDGDTRAFQIFNVTIMDRDGLIHHYFRMGMNHKDILLFLAQRHGIVISQRHLKRILARQGLYRRKYKSDVVDVALFIQKQLNESGQMHGYKWLHLKCLHQGLVVTQEDIRILLNVMDPEGVALRRRKRLRRRQYRSRGPNDCWHTDGYDKLTPYGINIHGCIDGFSRYIIWLNAYKTNRNPRIISGYYIKAVRERQACPRKVRGDRGTENCHIAAMQRFLRRNHTDSLAGDRSFVYGKSIANQRIEAWWGVLRKECSQYWMNLLSSLKDDGNFSGDKFDKNLVQFCFMNLIQVIYSLVPIDWILVYNMYLIIWCNQS